MAAYGDMASLVKYLKRQHLVDQFASYAERRGLRRRNLMIQRSYRLLEQYAISRVVYGMLDEAALIEYINQDDNTIREALRAFE